MSACPIFDPFDRKLGVRRKEVHDMTDELRAALADTEDQLMTLLNALRSAQHGSPHQLRRLRPYKAGGKTTPPFLFVDIPHVLGEKIDEYFTLPIPNKE